MTVLEAAMLEHDCGLEPGECLAHAYSKVVTDLVNAILSCSDTNWHAPRGVERRTVAETVYHLIERSGRVAALLTKSPRPTSSEVLSLTQGSTGTPELSGQDQEAAAALLYEFTSLAVQMMPCCENHERESPEADALVGSLPDLFLHHLVRHKEEIQAACRVD